MIKALFVDIGGVIVVNRAREVGEKFQNKKGLSIDITKKIFHFLQMDERSEGDFTTFLREQGVDENTWDRFLIEFYGSESRNDELIDLLKHAKAKGIKIVITTNNGSTVRKGMEKYGILDLPDLLINSSEYHMTKPDPAYWEVALQETRKLLPEIQPAEILVIDDSKTNCLSAKEFGFEVYQYLNEPESQKDISEIIFESRF